MINRMNRVNGRLEEDTSPLASAVRYDADQIRSEEEKAQARANMGAISAAQLADTKADLEEQIENISAISDPEAVSQMVEDVAKHETDISALKSSFVGEVYANLFNKNDTDILTGKYISRTGSLVDVPTIPKYIISGYIPVERNTTYVITQGTGVASQYGTNDYVTARFYNANKEYIWVKAGTSDSSQQFYTLTTPDTELSYMQVNIYDNLDGFMIIKGTEYPSAYIPYGSRKTLAEDVTPNDTYTYMLNPLWMKTAIFCGDSICEALYDNKKGWAGAIGDKNSMNWKNYGVSGMTITRETGHGSILNMSYTMETEFPNADYVIFEGGANDADVIGSILNGNVPADFGSFDMNDYSGTYDDTTFCGAVEKLFYRMITVWDKKKIGFIIAHKMGKVSTGYQAETNNRRAYFETIMTLCKKWGIPYINLWDGCYLNPSVSTCYNSDMTAEENRANGYPIYDGQHLSSEGYAVVSPMIEAWMKTL